MDGGIALKEKYPELYRISLQKQRWDLSVNRGGNGNSLGGVICLTMKWG